MRFVGNVALGLGSAVMIAAAAQAIPAPAYVMKAGAGDLYEKRSSTIVLRTTRDPAVRRFAQMMIRDHTRSTAVVKAAAMRAGIRPGPVAMDGQQLRWLADLRRAHGFDRDRLYLRQQREAHRDALQLHRDYADSGSVPSLRAAAARIVPVIRKHIDMLQAIRGR